MGRVLCKSIPRNAAYLVVVRTKHGVQNQFSECWLFTAGDNEAWKIAGQWV